MLKRSMVKVQEEDFDVSASLAWLRKGLPQVGAVACFVGTVRDVNDGESVSRMTLEHYPGMTEKSLEKIIQTAAERFDIESALIIHRVGPLDPEEQIVLAACTSEHRQQAFLGCEFLMDFLKTEAPFWKKESNQSGGGKWVEARDTDDTARKRWENQD